MSKRPKRLRWYDKHPVISEAMQFWQHYPPLLQRMIAYRLLEDLREGKYRKSYFGDPQSFLGVSLSKLPRLKGLLQKRRWYDDDANVRKVVMEMAFLDQQDLIRIAKHILRITPMLPVSPQQWSRLSLQEMKQIVTRAFEERILD